MSQQRRQIKPISVLDDLQTRKIYLNIITFLPKISYYIYGKTLCEVPRVYSDWGFPLHTSLWLTAHETTKTNQLTICGFDACAFSTFIRICQSLCVFLWTSYTCSPAVFVLRAARRKPVSPETFVSVRNFLVRCLALVLSVPVDFLLTYVFIWKLDRKHNTS